MSVLEGLRIFFGSVFILFVPGFVWSHVFFSKKKIDWIERTALSIGLSIALVPLVVFWFNQLFHVPITLLNTLLLTSGLIGAALVWLWARRRSWTDRLAGRIGSWFVSLKNKWVVKD